MTSIEDCIDVANDEGCREIAEAAWAEYCRLLDVVEAADRLIDGPHCPDPKECNCDQQVAENENWLKTIAALIAYKEAKK